MTNPSNPPAIPPKKSWIKELAEFFVNLFSPRPRLRDEVLDVIWVNAFLLAISNLASTGLVGLYDTFGQFNGIKGFFVGLLTILPLTAAIAIIIVLLIKYTGEGLLLLAAVCAALLWVSVLLGSLLGLGSITSREVDNLLDVSFPAGTGWPGYLFIAFYKPLEVYVTLYGWWKFLIVLLIGFYLVWAFRYKIWPHLDRQSQGTTLKKAKIGDDALWLGLIVTVGLAVLIIVNLPNPPRIRFDSSIEPPVPSLPTLKPLPTFAPLSTVGPLIPPGLLDTLNTKPTATPKSNSRSTTVTP